VPGYDAIVLAGGAATRLGGVDKPGLAFAGRSSLDRVLEALAGAGRIVVVGPRRPTSRVVTWCREDPPGSGPVAALRAGLERVAAHRVAVLAADLPMLDAATVDRLVAAATGRDGAVLVDAAGQRQVLLAVYDRSRLIGDVSDLPAGAAMRRAVAGLSLVEVPDTVGAAVDCDTWEQVEEVRRRL
jgi:molybdopterin-guanine dinucleotide biosynthesis protein A